jgi:hypothetical protein
MSTTASVAALPRVNVRRMISAVYEGHPKLLVVYLDQYGTIIPTQNLTDQERMLKLHYDRNSDTLLVTLERVDWCSYGWVLAPGQWHDHGNGDECWSRIA